MNTAKKSLKRLHQILQEKSSENPPPRSLHPRSEAEDTFDTSSLPPQRNRKLKGHRPTFFLSRDQQGSELLKRAAYLKQLNERVMGRMGLPYSAHLQLSSVTPKGVAVFHADSPAWVQKGRFLQQNLLDLLHTEGARGVTQVKLKVRFSHTASPLSPKPIKQPPSATATQLAQHAKESDGPLGLALRRLSNTLLRNR